MAEYHGISDLGGVDGGRRVAPGNRSQVISSAPGAAGRAVAKGSAVAVPIINGGVGGAGEQRAKRKEQSAEREAQGAKRKARRAKGKARPGEVASPSQAEE